MNEKVQTIGRGRYSDGDGDEQLDDYWLLRIAGEARPGHFIDTDAAEYAMPFCDNTLKDLQDRANDRSAGTQGIITLRDLQMAYVKDGLLHAGVHLAREEYLDAGMTPDEVIVYAMMVALWCRLCDLPPLANLLDLIGDVLPQDDNDLDQLGDMLNKMQDKIAARPFFRAVISTAARA